MKTFNFFVLAALFIILNTACNSDDDLNVFNVNGAVVSKITNEGFENSTIYIEVVKIEGSGIFSYETLIDSKTVLTDSQGKFVTNLNCRDTDNVIKFYKEDDEHSTGFLPEQRTNFFCSELLEEPIVFFVRKHETLQINVKNIDPFDNNDEIRVSIYQGHTNYGNDHVSAIENFLEPNQPHGYSSYEDGNNPFWIGKNVNSSIYYRIQENTNITVFWSVRKNGILTEYKSDPIQTISNEINEFEINY